MRTITNKRTMALLAAGLLLPALAGCSRSEPEEQPITTVENDAGVEEAMPEENMAATENEAEPAAVPANMAEAAPPPPPERTADQQMMDDASATGMTSRVERTPGDAPAEDGPKDGQ